MKLQNYVAGRWVEGDGPGTALLNAVNGEVVAYATANGLDFPAMLDHARRVGGPALRKMTFHARARMLKAMALHLQERKDDFYALSAATGATKADSWIDIDGGIGTFFVYASKGRREFPDEPFYIDGPLEPISKGGTFVGRHICVPMEGAAVFINAFNFPVWGMMEKMAPALLAGVPAIVKPATLTSYLTERVFRAMIDAKIFPDGAIQVICGSAGDLLDHLGSQDSVAFTGSAATGRKLKSQRSIIENAVRFNMEADSLNCAILGPDAAPGSEEFDLFIKEVAREMTSKAGQKCTAIRRTIVPDAMMDAVIAALKSRLSSVKVGDPAMEGVKMGPLAGREQVKEVGESVGVLKGGTELVYGGNGVEPLGVAVGAGAFFPITLLAGQSPLRGW
jgi:oxepin-CoA hydrolase/3-oxo-5,6-dehydrosuberyl-CoA semialdehyde dehydrogenase